MAKKQNIITRIWNNPDLKKRFIFTLGALLVYRFVAQVTVPGVDLEALRQLTESGAGNALGVISVFTGGSLENFAIIMMGLTPYINASIIMQLLAVAIPSLGEISKEGQEGQKKIQKYTRLLTLPLAALQGYGMILLLNRQYQVLPDITSYTTLIPALLTITAGAFFLVWLGELITENGLGNGVGLLIFTSIITSIPQQMFRNFQLSNLQGNFLSFALLISITIILTILVVIVNEGRRNIPVTYTSGGQSVKSHIPLRINQAGMIPIIFAISVLYFPSVFASFFTNATSPWLRDIATQLATPFNQGSPIYIAFYFTLLVAFSFFYVSITFKPAELAETIQKRGGFIAGLRPGKQTAAYLQEISHRLTFFGGLFIGFIAVFPLILQKFFTEFQLGTASLLISGAGLIIIVSTVLDMSGTIESKLQMQDYDTL